MAKRDTVNQPERLKQLTRRLEEACDQATALARTAQGQLAEIEDERRASHSRKSYGKKSRRKTAANSR